MGAMALPLVFIGDSLTQGFQHGAVRRTEWSYAAMVARALNVPLLQPDFSAGGLGGPLVDLELLARKLTTEVGHHLHWWNLPLAALTVQRFMDGIEDYWE